MTPRGCILPALFLVGALIFAAGCQKKAVEPPIRVVYKDFFGILTILNLEDPPIEIHKVVVNGEFEPRHQLDLYQRNGFAPVNPVTFPIRLTIGEDFDCLASSRYVDYSKSPIYCEVYTSRGKFRFDLTESKQAQ